MASQNIISTGNPNIMKVGSRTVSFQIALLSTSANYGFLSNDITGLTSLTRGTGANLTMSPAIGTGSDDMTASVAGFQKFWQKCPFRISRINLRATASTLPTSIVFQTYNVFTGQYDKQIVDVAPNIISTQYQSGIVTLATDILVGRTTTIHFIGSVATGSTLGVDFTITHFASLEEGLADFLTSNPGE